MHEQGRAPAERDLERRIRAVANEVLDPCACGFGAKVGIADLGLIRDIAVTPQSDKFDVALTLRVTEVGCMFFEYFESEVRRLLTAQPWVGAITIRWGDPFEWTPDEMSNVARAALRNAHVDIDSKANDMPTTFDKVSSQHNSG